jgi:hypothetical protein
MNYKIDELVLIGFNNELVVLKLNVFNNKKYNFFVCDVIDGFEILTGWEYIEDALDDLSEKRNLYDFHCKKELTVYTREYIKSLITLNK